MVHHAWVLPPLPGSHHAWVPHTEPHLSTTHLSSTHLRPPHAPGASPASVSTHLGLSPATLVSPPPPVSPHTASHPPRVSSHCLGLHCHLECSPPAACTTHLSLHHTLRPPPHLGPPRACVSCPASSPHLEPPPASGLLPPASPPPLALRHPLPLSCLGCTAAWLPPAWVTPPACSSATWVTAIAWVAHWTPLRASTPGCHHHWVPPPLHYSPRLGLAAASSPPGSSPPACASTHALQPALESLHWVPHTTPPHLGPHCHLGLHTPGPPLPEIPSAMCVSSTLAWVLLPRWVSTCLASPPHWACYTTPAPATCPGSHTPGVPPPHLASPTTASPPGCSPPGSPPPGCHALECTPPAWVSHCLGATAWVSTCLGAHHTACSLHGSPATWLRATRLHRVPPPGVSPECLRTAHHLPPESPPPGSPPPGVSTAPPATSTCLRLHCHLVSLPRPRCLARTAWVHAPGCHHAWCHHLECTPA
ncbi:hypothetical protein GPJ56_007228 [Histomonas meleagridis]|nr:hypothetical protein GPJ56_007228 [Histomonas meleagridis]